MKNEINSYKNQENKIALSNNKIKKYITVQKKKSKNKKLYIFSEKDKENINNIKFYLTNQVNDKADKIRKMSANTNVSSNNLLGNNNKNLNNSNNKNSLLIIQNELDEKSKSKTSKKKIFHFNHKNMVVIEKEINGIIHAKSYFSRKVKSKNTIDHLNDINTTKNKSKIKKNKISKTFSSNEINNNKKNIDEINNNKNYINIKTNKTPSFHGVTKDIIIEKENNNPNFYNTICINISNEFKKKNINNNLVENNINIKKRKKRIGKINSNIKEKKNTILIKRNNSALFTFGNVNNDSFDSNSKGTNVNTNILLLLKKENESLMKELMQTKEKVGYLEKKIDNLICENNTNRNIYPNYNLNEEEMNNKRNTKNKKSIGKTNNIYNSKNKEKIKDSLSQRDFKSIYNRKKIKAKNISRENTSNIKIKIHKTPSNKFCIYKK